MQTIDAPFELKAAGDTGVFEGYAAVFGNKDLGDDVIVPGAFEQVKTTRDGMLRIALYHDLWQLAGKAEYSQDDHGLHVKGQMNLKVSYARDAYELMKDGTLDGMSVGFNILENGYSWVKDDQEGEYRLISRAELWEASIVPYGMNPEAKIESVKEAFAVREFEKFLRDSGKSRKEAVAMANFLNKAIQREADALSLSESGELDSAKLDQVKRTVIQHFCIK